MAGFDPNAYAAKYAPKADAPQQAAPGGLLV